MSLKEKTEKYNLDSIYSESEDVEDLVSEIILLKKEGYFDGLKKAYKNKDWNFKILRLSDKELPLTSLFANAFVNLNYPKKYFSDTNMRYSITFSIQIQKVLSMYDFIEAKYSMDTGIPLNNELTRKIDLNGLDKKITYGLDKFDKFKDDNNKSFLEFFTNFKQAQWQDDGKKIFKKLSKIRIDLTYEMFNSRYWKIDDNLLEYLSVCSAINDGRTKIGSDDVFKAYKTFLKILQYNTSNCKGDSSNQFHGGLFCPKCGLFYEFHENESADDFIQECDCGGKLRNINYIEEIYGKYVPKGTRIIIAIAIAFSCFILTLIIVQYLNINTINFTPSAKRGLYLSIALPILAVALISSWLLFRLLGYNWKNNL